MTANIRDHQSRFDSLRSELYRGIIGYRPQLDRLLQCALMGGHVLEEGVPGVAKTLKMKYLGKLLGCSFARIQFTPDTDPSSIVGYMAADGYRPGDFTRGANLVLLDEINRGSPDCQAATLEAMAEGNVTIEGHSFPMPKFFLAVGTANPIESDGVNPIPHAQLDRLAVKLYYRQPKGADLKKILLETAMGHDLSNMDRIKEAVCSVDDLLAIRAHINDNVRMPDALLNYAVALIDATSPDRTVNPDPKLAAKLSENIRFGVGPRGAQWVIRLSRARAWMEGRDVVTGDDVQDVLTDIIRPRLVLADDVEDGEFTAEQLAELVIGAVPVHQG